MKKLLLSLIFALAVVPSTFAQEIKHLMAEFAKVEGFEHQILDKEMLTKQFNAAMDSDSAEVMEEKMPSFMQKIETLEVVVSSKTSEETKANFMTRLSSLKNDPYEQLLKVKKEDVIVDIKADKKEEMTDVYILVVAQNVIVIVQMSGPFSEKDLMDIVEEQQNNLN